MNAIGLYLADTAVGGNATSVVSWREADRGRERDRTDRFLRDRERGKCRRLTTTIRICASGRGFERGSITDPLSSPDGTLVTKVGLICGAKDERVRSVDVDAVGRT